MTNEPDDEILEDFAPNRRRFVKGVVAATAFAAPMVASFDLTTLSTSNAYAQSMSSTITSNTTSTTTTMTGNLTTV